MLSEKDKIRLMGQCRIAFKYSELRKDALEFALSDVKGVRGGKMYDCQLCHESFTPKDLEIDHFIPIIPITMQKKDMDIHAFIDRLFCGFDNLTVVCKDCHKLKSKGENAIRRESK